MTQRIIEKCFDEGTIQAFLDGELASDLSENVACHVSVCDACASMLAFAEEENSFAFAALDTEFNALVPTERIRTRLFETIEAERASFWQRVFGKGFRWTHPSVSAFASLLLIVGIFGTLWIARDNSIGGRTVSQAENTITPSTRPVSAQFDGDRAHDSQNPAPVTVADDDNNNEEKLAPTVQTPVFKPKNENRLQAQRAVYVPEKNSTIEDRKLKVKDVAVPTPATYSATIVGEESYIRTIAALKQTVDSRKDELMRPSSRVAFERDLAVVDDAIKKMQREIRKNPRNQAAREMLRVSYQNKIDLLNSAAEKSELMAALD